jgi:hypothetical protein
VNKYPENGKLIINSKSINTIFVSSEEPKTNDSYFKYQGDIPISTKNPSFTYQESESPRKSFASASGDFSKMIPLPQSCLKIGKLFFFLGLTHSRRN